MLLIHQNLGEVLRLDRQAAELIALLLPPRRGLLGRLELSEGGELLDEADRKLQSSR